MSRLTELIAQVSKSNPDLAEDLRREIAVLSNRRPFGLNFERHVPETIQLPGRRVRRGDTVLFRPPKDSKKNSVDSRTWIVTALSGKGDDRFAKLLLREDTAEPVEAESRVSDLVVIAEFRDPIYPGLRTTEMLTSGSDKPFHSVINGENYHVLEALTFALRGSVDCIYIDPPYNTRDKDWKYNNDYVDSDDAYRHSKWLAMMERRLRLAKELLDPSDSVLIVTIDEKEYLRLGLLLEQLFPDCRIQMVSSLINPASMPRQRMFGRSDEYLFYVFLGAAAPEPVTLNSEWVSSKGRTFKGEIRWDLVMQSGPGSERRDSPNGFYPIYVDPDGPRIHSVGEPLPKDEPRPEKTPRKDLIPLWPIRKNGSEGRWRMTNKSLRERLQKGLVRLGGNQKRGYTLYYLPPAEAKKIEAGLYEVTGKRPDGSLITSSAAITDHVGIPTTQWRVRSHDATQYGSRLLDKIIPGRKFPFPKSLYAVEDALRFVVGGKPQALILDFFAGSGTTAHAVARLNRQDGGSRRSICVTNNEVSAAEAAALSGKGFRPGDPEWEAQGICEYITKPRVKSCFTGNTPTGEPIPGNYKFTDEFPMADGFEENVVFFDLTYEEPVSVAYGLSFEAIAPLLWLRAGARGMQIERVADDFAIADSYAILFDVDAAAAFVQAVRSTPGAGLSYVITDDESQFQAVAAQLPSRITPIRLYSAYLNNFSRLERD
jgi:adenine-specific DNA-methyltransferase